MKVNIKKTRQGREGADGGGANCGWRSSRANRGTSTVELASGRAPAKSWDPVVNQKSLAMDGLVSTNADLRTHNVVCMLQNVHRLNPLASGNWLPERLMVVLPPFFHVRLPGCSPAWGLDSR